MPTVEWPATRFHGDHRSHTAMETIDRTQLKPIHYPDLIRLGALRDGGYVVPEVHVKRSTVLLSLGMKQNWSFEKDFAAANTAGVRVIGVDPGVGPRLFARQLASSAWGIVRDSLGNNRRRIRAHMAVLRNSLDYFWFFGVRHHHIRKAVAGSLTTTTITMGRLLEMSHAAGPHAVFLKMDIEGAEYAVVPDIGSLHERINCIVAELHRLGRKAATANRTIAQLLQHFRIVHIHGNNYSDYDAVNDFPDAVEITFVNKALCPEPAVPTRREYPTPGLDFPNRPARPDHQLRFE